MTIQALQVLGVCEGACKGFIHNLLAQYFTLGSSKIKVSQICLFEIVTTQNDHLNYVKHVLGSIYVSFTLFGVLVVGGSAKGMMYNLLLQFFTLGRSKIEVSEAQLFDIVPI